MCRTLKLPYLAESGDALTIAAKSMLVFVGSHLVLRILRTSVRPRVTLKLVPMVTVISLMWPVAAHAAEPFRLIITESVTPLVPNSVMELALEFGYFRREGVEVRLIRVDQTPLAVAGLVSGDGDMANISIESVMHLAARGQRQWKAVVVPNKSLPFLIAARRGITSLADLAGRIFGVGRIGSLDHSLSASVLRSRGVDPAFINFVSIGQPQMRAQALAMRRIDATTVSTGTWIGLAERVDLHVLVPQKEYFAAAPLINKVNVVSSKAMVEKRSEVLAVVTALIKASRDFERNPRDWVSAMRKLRPDVTQETLASLAATFAKSWSVNGGMNARELQYTADWLYQSPDFKDVPRIQPTEWIDFSVADEVLSRIGIDPSSDEPVR
jgi:NitT/TauT family transport system substrate-binding protein